MQINISEPVKFVSWCPTCGPEPRCDEDGCCAVCGATTGEVPDWRALMARVSELEDTVLLEREGQHLHTSYGRDERANRILADIAARRGPDWTGAEVGPKAV